MRGLQQVSRGPASVDVLSRFPIFVKEASDARNLRFGSRSSPLNLSVVAPEETGCVLRISGCSTHPLFGTLSFRQSGDRPVMAKAGKLHGLGEIFNDGYELTDHVVVDKDHTVDVHNEVIEKLITGFKTFKEGVFKQKPELYDKLRNVQEPKMMMITCADSRVCPTMLHGLEAGEAFIVRNVANLVPPCEESGENHGTSAAIEYAVTVLNVENIIVMGHSSCGGIKALMSRNDFSGDFIGSWVQIGMPAKEKTLSIMGNKPFHKQCSFCEQWMEHLEGKIHVNGVIDYALKYRISTEKASELVFETIVPMSKDEVVITAFRCKGISIPLDVKNVENVQRNKRRLLVQQY